MKLHFVDAMDEVLKIALERPLPELPVEEPVAASQIPVTIKDQPTAHQ
jgi:ATP-dependent Lon protease